MDKFGGKKFEFKSEQIPDNGGKNTLKEEKEEEKTNSLSKVFS